MEMLQLWLAIHKETMQLCETIAALPESCECGDAEAHLAGRCACCRHRRSEGAGGSGVNCMLVLARLHADLAMLCQDFAQAADPLQEAALDAAHIELRRDVFLAAKDLHQIVADLDTVSDAVMGFRRSCTITEMQRVKRHSAELKMHCEQLSAQLLGGSQ